eukprot:107371_1
MIPTFEHLHLNEFIPPMYENNDNLAEFFSDDDDNDDIRNDNEFKQKQNTEQDDKASYFAMLMLKSVSPAAQTNNQSQRPSLTNNKSIFAMGQQLDVKSTNIPNTTFTSSASNMDMDRDSDRDSDRGSDLDSPSPGGFLSRTDTVRDKTSNTIREMKQSWVNFEVDDEDPFSSPFFAEKNEQNDDLSEIFSSAESLRNVSDKKKIRKRITGGIGTAFSKVKKKG